MFDFDSSSDQIPSSLDKVLVIYRTGWNGNHINAYEDIIIDFLILSKYYYGQWYIFQPQKKMKFSTVYGCTNSRKHLSSKWKVDTDGWW